MKILITGGTGFLGHHISRLLLFKNHDLVILSRNAEKARSTFPFPAQFHSWDPLKGPPPMEAFEGVQAIIHLAGESVAGGRWTLDQKRRILDSRVLSTRHLWKGVAQHAPGLSTFISASAIGYYGDRGDEEVTEMAPPGSGFLAEVCQAWETEIFHLGFDQVRQIAIRVGVVLGRESGALAKLLPVFKSGVGGPVGGGKQWMSWIHVEDLARAFVEVLENAAYRGPVNAVAPSPVTNADFSKTLGSVLHRPAFMPAPAAVLRLALGEMASVVLEGQKVRPEKLAKNGFVFKFPALKEALSDLCELDDGSSTEEFRAEQWVNKPVADIFHFFSKAENLEDLTPPWVGFKILSSSTPEIAAGTLIDYKISVHGIPMKWRTLIETWEPGSRFVDTQLSGPYSKWHHTHTFEPMKGGTLMRDRVLYRLPLGLLGKSLAQWKVKRDIEQIFAYRRKRVREIFGN